MYVPDLIKKKLNILKEIGNNRCERLEGVVSSPQCNDCTSSSNATIFANDMLRIFL